MSAKLGHAVCDENGKAKGGKPGNQTGKELRFQSYYKNDKGWNVLRTKDKTVAAKIAKAMTDACNNMAIGYCQTTRGQLQTEAKKVNFNLATVKTPCNCDCSSLVRACCFAAGLSPASFHTEIELKVLMATNAFTQLKEPWTEKDLQAGDILVTKVKGHTAIVVSTTNAPAPVQPTPTVTPPTSARYVEIKGSSVNVRAGDNVNTARLGTVHRGDPPLPYYGVAISGWYKVNYKGRSACISNRADLTKLI